MIKLQEGCAIWRQQYGSFSSHSGCSRQIGMMASNDGKRLSPTKEQLAHAETNRKLIN